jgi:hypothetical protein
MMETTLFDNVDDNDPDADWFCWQCECIDDCLGMVNEQSETDTRAWEDLFPELRSTEETGLLGKLKNILDCLRKQRRDLYVFCIM